MKILYFTATGNSLYVAKSLGGELLSIPQMVKNGNYHFSDDKIGIVFPLHAWSVPTYVENFLKKATFDTKYLFAIVTYGIFSAGVASHLLKIAKNSNYTFSYINKILMVDNYLPFFDMKKEIQKEPKKGIEKKLQLIKNHIENSKLYIPKELFLRKLATNYMVNKGKKGSKQANKKKKSLKIHTPGEGIENYIYFNKDSCTMCGTCASVCPVDNFNLDYKNREITLNNNCFLCFSCIQNCPTNTIHIRGEVNSNRFRNKSVSLKEIIDSNR